jgi:predicted transcriptional regulator
LKYIRHGISYGYKKHYDSLERNNLMATLMEMVAEIVSAHASSNQMSSDDLLTELQKVHSTLKSLESGLPVAGALADAKPTLTIKQAFKKDEVVCMICGKGGFKTLTRHLNMAHELKPGQYRKQFKIPSSQSLSAKNYSESRRQAALDRGLGDNLAKARKVRAEKIAAAKAPEKSAKPVKAASQPKAVKTASVAKLAKAAKAKVSTKAAPKAKAPAKAKAVNA